MTIAGEVLGAAAAQARAPGLWDRGIAASCVRESRLGRRGDRRRAGERSAGEAGGCTGRGGDHAADRQAERRADADGRQCPGLPGGDLLGQLASPLVAVLGVVRRRVLRDGPRDAGGAERVVGEALHAQADRVPELAAHRAHGRLVDRLCAHLACGMHSV